MSKVVINKDNLKKLIAKENERFYSQEEIKSFNADVVITDLLELLDL